jgi:ferredoxin
MSATVRFEPLGIEGAALDNETILDVARRVSAPVGNSCGGTGICGRCRVTILEGEGNLSPATWIEQNGEFDSLASRERLACQASPRGPVAVTTTYWGYRRR